MGKSRARIEETANPPAHPASLANGWIRASEISWYDVLALYSGYHAEPNTMEFIHALEPVLPRVAYVNYKGDKWRGGSKTVYIGGRENQRFGEVEVVPYETRDAGNMGSLGSLVKTRGLTVFYPNFFPEGMDAFKKEIDTLAQQSTRCDIAFVETASEQPAAYATYIIERLKPRVVVPFDRGGSLAAAEALATELRKKYANLQVAVARDPGDRLDYVGGKVTSAFSSTPPVPSRNPGRAAIPMPLEERPWCRRISARRPVSPEDNRSRGGPDGAHTDLFAGRRLRTRSIVPAVWGESRVGR